MSVASEISRMSLTYPTARITGRRMTRLPEQSLGWAVLDAATADELGREHIGWFVGNHPGLTRAAEQLGRLDTNPEGGAWVVVPLGRGMSCELYDKWPYRDHVAEPPNSFNSVWRSRKVWVAIPEDLKQLLPLAQKLAPGLSGVIIIDPDCLMYRSRAGTDVWGHRHSNDRPKHIVNFRADLGANGWQPPILLLTERPPKAINTDVVARAYCLNAFHFIAGESFECSDVAIDQD